MGNVEEVQLPSNGGETVIRNVKSISWDKKGNLQFTIKKPGPGAERKMRLKLDRVTCVVKIKGTDEVRLTTGSCVGGTADYLRRMGGAECRIQIAASGIIFVECGAPAEMGKARPD